MGLLINKEIEIKITVAKYFLKKSRGPPAFLFLKKYKTICHIIKKEVVNKMAGRNLIIGMTFPKQDTNLGLEPSLLTVFPEGDNVIYSMENDHSYDDDDVMYYLCNVYITGMHEFIEWSKYHEKEKIIVGGYEPTINPQDFTDYAGRVMVGPCNDFYASIDALKRNSLRTFFTEGLWAVFL